MKNVFLMAGLLLFCFLSTSTSGYDGMMPAFDREYTPVLMKRADLENSVRYRPEARALTNPGKIYAKPPYIYVNERYKGVHVINNTDPAHPVKEGFISAPGCMDMAVKGDILYLDNSVDLVAFHLAFRKVTRRVKNVFPQPLAPDNSTYYPEEGMVVVGWKKNTHF
ncbi:MAG: hypothetical protein LBP25_03420 [Tannerellaceae bacterium]|jgi:hypothetical protein|nr:hypothetical protein [Tannerellaceae bacterium]